ncbi:MAG: hypothetical protein ACFB20_11045 [Opitutales bacterium]
MRLGLCAGLLALLLFLLGVLSLSSGPQPSASTVPSVTAEGVESLQFETDGVLTREWLLRTLRLDLQAPGEAQDIFALKRALESQGQVRRAVVEQVPNGPLRFRLEERRPVFRLALLDDNGQPDILLVAGDGHLYRGDGYAQARLRDLPFLADETVELDPLGSMLPLEGLYPLTHLLAEARKRFPRLARQWHSFRREGDLQRGLHPEAFIEVTTFSGGQLIFRPRGFVMQLERLEEVLLQVRPSGLRKGERLDLSFREPYLTVAGGRQSAEAYP